MADLNFDQYLAEDTPYQAALAAIGAREKADRAVLNATGQSLVIPYGEVPDFPQGGTPFGIGDPQGMSQQDIWNQMFDPETRRLAGEATSTGVSTVAQSQHDRDVNYANMINELTGRGAIRSGAFGIHSRDVQQRFQDKRYSDLQTLLGLLGQDWSTYLGTEATRRQERSDATNAALSRIIAKIQAGLIGGGNPDPLANPNDPRLVPNRFLPTPTNTPNLFIPGVDENGYAIVNPYIYANPDPYVTSTQGQQFAQGPLPNTPFSPVPEGTQLAMEPHIASDTAAFGPQGVANPNPPEPAAAPTIPQYQEFTPSDIPDYSNNYFESNQSPDIPDYPNYTPPQPAAPTVPVIGYGGNKTAGQVSRNNY